MDQSGCSSIWNVLMYMYVIDKHVINRYRGLGVDSDYVQFLQYWHCRNLDRHIHIYVTYRHSAVVHVISLSERPPERTYLSHSLL